MFGYSNKELERKAAGENVFPHVFGTDDQGRDIMVRVMVGEQDIHHCRCMCSNHGIDHRCVIRIHFRLLRRCRGHVMQRIVEIIYSIPEMLIILLLIRNLKTGTGTVPELR